MVPASSSSVLKKNWVAVIQKHFKVPRDITIEKYRILEPKKKKKSALEERMSNATPHFMDEGA